MHTSFRELCAQHGIAVTQQRKALYEVMQGMEGHPSPEEIYAEVRRTIPDISLATVYKNIHLFVASGVLREVSLHHGSQRVERNEREHHHLVCSRCKAIADIGPEELGAARLLRRRKLPGGFMAERVSVDVIGVCAKCQEVTGVATAEGGFDAV